MERLVLRQRGMSRYSARTAQNMYHVRFMDDPVDFLEHRDADRAENRIERRHRYLSPEKGTRLAATEAVGVTR